MWWTLPILLGISIVIRQNPIIRARIQKWQFVSSIGIQVWDHIYTLQGDLQTDSTCVLDLVFVWKHHDHYHVRRMMHSDIRIETVHVPVGHKLKYIKDGREHNHLYMPGSPFRVSKGELILLQQKKRMLGMTYEELKRSNSWPM